MTINSIHDCPCCICGQIELMWSDRVAHVFIDNFAGIADVIVACVLDHHYDRGDGIPMGLSSATADRLGPIIERHLSAKAPDWRKRTVEFNDEEREHLYNDIMAVLLKQLENDDEAT